MTAKWTSHNPTRSPGIHHVHHRSRSNGELVITQSNSTTRHTSRPSQVKEHWRIGHHTIQLDHKAYITSVTGQGALEKWSSHNLTRPPGIHHARHRSWSNGEVIITQSNSTTRHTSRPSQVKEQWRSGHHTIQFDHQAYITSVTGQGAMEKWSSHNPIRSQGIHHVRHRSRSSEVDITQSNSTNRHTSRPSQVKEQMRGGHHTIQLDHQACITSVKSQVKEQMISGHHTIQLDHQAYITSVTGQGAVQKWTSHNPTRTRHTSCQVTCVCFLRRNSCHP